MSITVHHSPPSKLSGKSIPNPNPATNTHIPKDLLVDASLRVPDMTADSKKTKMIPRETKAFALGGNSSEPLPLLYATELEANVTHLIGT